jgi:superfamily II RNA helicase
MVIHCSSIPFSGINNTDNQNSYEIYFETYYANINLSEFQKWAIKSVIDGDHVLVTAHTGSGKTLPAEFAIQHLVSQGKKVIYTTPIKALSNQKLFDFRRKFPHISFGILTGDCKDNPEADVLIMTTEILRNTLFNKKINETSNEKLKNETPLQQQQQLLAPLSFEMDFNNELGAVVFDEVHYINDAERGSVWEQSILLLPPQVQLVMLSATIDKPDVFASWIEEEKNKQAKENNIPPKKMYLTTTNERVVPLTHYMWVSVHSNMFYSAKKTPYEQKLIELHKKPVVISTSNGVFHDINYHKVNDCLSFMNKKNSYIKRQFVLNEIIQYLKEKEMLPAICFVFSRKNVEYAAKEISICLFEKDSGIPAIIEKECRHIMMSKLPNYQEYINLPEYIELIALLEKGIAIHHAGMMPVLREMVELLFEKGFIKLLVATETFAVGINMPTKTVIFTGLTKFNGYTMRLLYPHEYTQMAGRAGRRGIDTIGHVIHCNNLFEMPLLTDYKNMLIGKPQTLTSKFKISYPLVLSILSQKKDQTVINEFVEKSLLAYDIKREVEKYNEKEEELNEKLTIKIEQLSLCRTPHNKMKEYVDKTAIMQMSSNSNKKKLNRELNDIETEYKFLEPDLKKYYAWENANKEFKKNNMFKKNTEEYINGSINQIITNILLPNGFMKDMKITEKGIIASQLQEVHSLVFADTYINTEGFNQLSANELAGLFSCFTNINVMDDNKQINPPEIDGNYTYDLQKVTIFMRSLIETYECIETKENIDSGSCYVINYDIQKEILEWTNCKNEEECKNVISLLKLNKKISLGDFVKAILKINNIAAEIGKICEITNNIILLEKVKKIPELTMKYVVTNQSLYL